MCSSICELLIYTEKLLSVFINLRNCSQRCPRFRSPLSVNNPQFKCFMWGIERSATCQVFKYHLIWGSRCPPPPSSSSCHCTSLFRGRYYSGWQFLVHGFWSKAHFLSQTVVFHQGSCRDDDSRLFLTHWKKADKSWGQRYLCSMKAWRLLAWWGIPAPIKEGCWRKRHINKDFGKAASQFDVLTLTAICFWIPAYAKCFSAEILISPPATWPSCDFWSSDRRSDYYMIWEIGRPLSVSALFSSFASQQKTFKRKIPANLHNWSWSPKRTNLVQHRSIIWFSWPLCKAR